MQNHHCTADTASSLHCRCRIITALQIQHHHCTADAESSLHCRCRIITALQMQHHHCTADAESSLHCRCSIITALQMQHHHCTADAESSLHCRCRIITALQMQHHHCTADAASSLHCRCRIITALQMQHHHCTADAESSLNCRCSWLIIHLYLRTALAHSKPLSFSGCLIPWKSKSSLRRCVSILFVVSYKNTYKSCNTVHVSKIMCGVISLFYYDIQKNSQFNSRFSYCIYTILGIYQSRIRYGNCIDN